MNQEQQTYKQPMDQWTYCSPRILSVCVRGVYFPGHRSGLLAQGVLNSNKTGCY